MRVYISSTPEELEPHRMAAVEVAAELGWEPVLRDPAAGRGLDPVAACERQVAGADFVVAIVGWRRGSVPRPELGGDGLRFWAWWEVRSAFDHGKPVVVLMAAGSWRPELREDDPRARAVMRDFRGELDRVAVFFDDEGQDEQMRGFRDLVRRELIEARTTKPRQPSLGSPYGPEPDGARLRRWPPPTLPELPYPLLLPYNHPDFLAGRELDLEELRRILSRRLPIVGLHAPSGTGKSSLLAGALVPRLRSEGAPVAFDRHPAEPGLAGRLLDHLLEEPAETDIARGVFIDRLSSVRRLAQGDVPLLILDQFEDLLRSGSARAQTGQLLAASIQRLPEFHGPVCQWLLAYRREFHGEVLRWLSDVLRDARAEGFDVESLPHELSRPERFCGWPLWPLATPRLSPSGLTSEPGSEAGVAEAARVFQEAIEKPLSLNLPDGGPRYTWSFAPGHAARLARAFGEARVAQTEASLVPELQVVLAHLLNRAGLPPPAGGRTLEVTVPEEPGEMIDRALEEHLRRALDIAYPAAPSKRARILRTRALLALRELAGAGGRSEEGLPADSLVKALSGEVLEKLATPQTRLVVLEEHAGGWRYVLSHDRMAELLVRLVDSEEVHARLGVNGELLGLRRFVTLQSALYASGDMEQATAVPASYFGDVEANREVLFWHDQHRTWWQACRERRRLERRRNTVRHVVAMAVAAVVALGAWTVADRRSRRRALLEEVASGEPEAAFATLAQLVSEPEADAGDLLALMRRRDKPLDVLEVGLGGVAGAQRGAAVLRVVELVLPVLEEAPEDPARIATTAWALDFFAMPDPVLKPRASALRDAILGPLRGSRPPPRVAPDDPAWADVPAGSFWAEYEPGPNPKVKQGPRQRVTISAFRIMKHEVTNADYRRLVPDYEGDGDLPVSGMNWSRAYTYAAWLGGRLPTEAEFDYAARAGCAYEHCGRDGSEATLDEVAWWMGNATSPGESAPSKKAVGQLEPNPWGLFDMYGNVREFTANWAGVYPGDTLVDPSGPTKAGSRVCRGGRVRSTASRIKVGRLGVTVKMKGFCGFRVVFPAPP